MERGESIEKAIKSLINSGYNPAEVNSVAKNFVSGAISTTSEPSSVPSPTLPIIQEKQQFKPITQRLPYQTQYTRHPNRYKPLGPPKPGVNYLLNQQKKPSNTGKIIALIIILLILLGALIATIMFREQLINFLTNLF